MPQTQDTAGHIELYKRYRPTRWGALIGQEKVAKSLQNAVKAQKLPTAYLFAGPRGCGKTTAAFILTKALNCLNPKVETADPCNECEVCRAIDDGTQLGVTYMSAASVPGVDEMRRLVQQARTHQPIKKQVFIIDEVHNLRSGKGFEALLIPLEEKDMPALFIFCTTEIDKVPTAVLSRLQQRRFGLVDAEAMTLQLSKISKHAQLDVSEETIAAAVRLGRGSVRDSLTHLESLLETGVEVTPFGTALLEGLIKQDVGASLAVLAEANQVNPDFREISETLFEDLRDLLLLSQGVDASLVGIPSVKDVEAAVAGLMGEKGILLYMREVGEAISSMALGLDSRIVLETALVKSLATIRRSAAKQA